MSRKHVLIAVLVLVFGVIGWNTAWRYDDVPMTQSGITHTQRIRTHIITGRAEILTQKGWLAMR